MTDNLRPISYTGPLACPECGSKVTGHWLSSRKTADQQCPACGHVWEATWPGFSFEPELVIVNPDGTKRPPTALERERFRASRTPGETS